MTPKSSTRGKKEGAPPRVRMRREVPERNGPLRSRSIFDPMAGFGQAAGSGQTTAAGSPRPGEERVERVVNTAYRVCEEHLRRGREAAARQREHFVPKEAPRYDRSDPYDDLRRRSRQVWDSMYHSMYDLMNLWMEMVAPFLPSDTTRPWSAPQPEPPREYRAGGSSDPATEDFDRAAGPAERLAATLQVSSKLPVRATVEVQADAVLHDCLLNKLRQIDGGQIFPFAGSGTIKVDASGRVHLVLTVPDGQQPGTYLQELWDDQHHEPVGTVTITVYSLPTAH